MPNISDKIAEIEEGRFITRLEQDSTSKTYNELTQKIRELANLADQISVIDENYAIEGLDAAVNLYEAAFRLVTAAAIAKPIPPALQLFSSKFREAAFVASRYYRSNNMTSSVMMRGNLVSHLVGAQFSSLSEAPGIVSFLYGESSDNMKASWIERKIYQSHGIDEIKRFAVAGIEAFKILFAAHYQILDSRRNEQATRAF